MKFDIACGHASYVTCVMLCMHAGCSAAYCLPASYVACLVLRLRHTFSSTCSVWITYVSRLSLNSTHKLSDVLVLVSASEFVLFRIPHRTLLHAKMRNLNKNKQDTVTYAASTVPFFPWPSSQPFPKRVLSAKRLTTEICSSMNLGCFENTQTAYRLSTTAI